MDPGLFSKAFEHPAGSPIRELFPYLQRPGMISFAGGHPSPALFDLEGLMEASGRALSSSVNYQYGPTEGQAVLRERLAALCATRGIDVTPQQIAVTTGSQQAFDLLVRTLINPGDTVLIESPAYPASIQSLKLAGAHIVEVGADAHGLSIDQLSATLEQCAGSFRPKPKLLYTVPNFSNPGGTVMATDRRRQLAELAVQHGFLVIEDDPYGDLNFTGADRPSIYQIGEQLFGQDNPVIYLSSLSKTVAPALRTGWMIGPSELLRRCIIAKQTADLCSSPLTQLIAAEYLALGRYHANVVLACTEYRARMERMAAELAARLGESMSFVKPEGGMFVWVNLKHGVDADRLFAAAVELGVVYVPGKAFFVDKPNARALRLSFATSTTAEITVGMDRLAQAFDRAGR